jgi:hypothetical protein
MGRGRTFVHAMKTLLRAGSCCAALVMALAAHGHAQAETLDSVLARAGAYVIEFQRQLSGIVAQEHYVQDVRIAMTGARSRFMAPAQLSHRELTSDFLLVKPIGGDRYVEFRDVFDVDGRAVRDRDDRLTKLFLEPNRSAADQIQKIIAESTRYNIGNLQRTINVPVLPLLILDLANQPRFRFKQIADGTPLMARESDKDTDAAAPSRFRVPTGAWVVQYEEVQKLTMIRTTNGRDMPARGRFWIEPAAGRVLMSELVAEDFSLRGTVGVSYEPGPIAGLLVPVEMRERYDLRRDGSRIEGTATYSKFRQFQVKVDEKIAPIKNW